MSELVSIGLLIHISELDVRVNTQPSDVFLFNSEFREAQADMYESIVRMYNAIPESQKFAITTWGVTDKYSWFLSYWHELEYPLLLDGQYNQKEAYKGFLNGLK